MEEVINVLTDTMKMITDESLKNDRSLLELIQAVIARMDIIERRVEMLMELHILRDSDSGVEN